MPFSTRSMHDSPLVAAIEAGGTKFICAVGTGPDDVRGEMRIPTTTPEETLHQVVEYLRMAQEQAGPVKAIGVGTFGPAGLQRGAADYGFITTTPKPGWKHTDLLGLLNRHFPVPMSIDTDVNAAALGEWKWGAGRGTSVVVYVTVGTGIGGGLVVDGRPHHGLVHPEMGHMRLPHELTRDPFPGCCPWHGDCLEGLACGVAMEQRWGAKAENLPQEHPAWDLQAHYLALAAANILLTVSPQRLIIGGGVLAGGFLLPMIREATAKLLAGYVQHPMVLTGLDEIIVAPGLGHQSGLLGALALAQEVAL